MTEVNTADKILELEGLVEFWKAAYEIAKAELEGRSAEKAWH